MLKFLLVTTVFLVLLFSDDINVQSHFSFFENYDLVDLLQPDDVLIDVNLIIDDSKPMVCELYQDEVIGEISNVLQRNVGRIQYDGGGHTSGTVPSAHTLNVPGSATLRQPGTLARTNHRFNGWRSDSSFNTFSAGATVIFNNASTVTYQAVWCHTNNVTGTIMYRGGGHTHGTVPGSHTLNVPGSATLRQPGITRTGYTFVGWRSSSSGNIFQPGATVTFSNPCVVIYTAVWTPNNAFGRPMAFAHVTSAFGYRASGFHRGLDLASSRNNREPILAVAAGTVHRIVRGCVEGVTTCGGGYGNYIILRHNIGGTTYYSLYAHLNSITSSLNVGNTVTLGQQIGVKGNTGSSTGPHLHLEIHRHNFTYSRNTAINPSVRLDLPNSWTTLRLNNDLYEFDYEYALKYLLADSKYQNSFVNGFWIVTKYNLYDSNSNLLHKSNEFIGNNFYFNQSGILMFNNEYAGIWDIQEEMLSMNLINNISYFNISYYSNKLILQSQENDGGIRKITLTRGE